MFAFLLEFTPHFLLCKSLWLHVCVCTLSASQGDQTLCRIQHFTQDFPKVPRVFHRSIFRFRKAQRDKNSQFWKSLSARIVQSVLKLKHLRSTLGLFCMVDLEIQALSKPNSINILAPFRDQTTACLSYLLPTSTAVHPYRILKSSIALARPEENESPLQAQLCAWNDVHLSHLTDSHLLFRFCSRHQNYLHGMIVVSSMEWTDTRHPLFHHFFFLPHIECSTFWGRVASTTLLYCSLGLGHPCRGIVQTATFLGCVKLLQCGFRKFTKVEQKVLKESWIYCFYQLRFSLLTLLLWLFLWLLSEIWKVILNIRINIWSFTKLDPLFCMNQTIASECVSWFWGHCPSPWSGRGQQQSKDVIETEVLAAVEHTQDVCCTNTEITEIQEEKATGSSKEVCKPETVWDCDLVKVKWNFIQIVSWKWCCYKLCATFHLWSHWESRETYQASPPQRRPLGCPCRTWGLQL